TIVSAITIPIDEKTGGYNAEQYSGGIRTGSDGNHVRGRLLIESVDQNHRRQDYCHQRQTAGG
ncbi:hypothetical protein LAM20_21895, partial [Mycobacterium tuberculosis]|nr:hypothetical protein [Mycobacterium tuberculosis]